MQSSLRVFLRRAGPIALALGLGLGLGSAATAQVDETERWVPSFSVRSGVTASKQTASSSSVVVPVFDFTGDIYCNGAGLAPGCAIPLDQRVAQPELIWFEFSNALPNPPNPPINLFSANSGPATPPVAGTELVMTPWVGTSIELMSPGLQSLPTRPRFFVHGDVQYQFGVPRSIAREGKPAAAPPTALPPGFLQTFNVAGQPGVTPPGVNLAFPATSTLTFPAQAGNQFASAELLAGQGTKIETSEEPWVWGAGAGVAFTFELFERRLRVKPSVEYQRRKLTVKSTANSAFPSAQQGNLTQGITPNFNIVQLQATDELDLHGLGPGLELELDTWQVGPLMLSVFVQGQAYYTLGDTELSAGGYDGLPCNETDGSNLQRVCQRIQDRVVSGGPFNGLSRQERPANQTLSGAGINDVFAEFDYKIDPWTIQAGVGLRFRALPDNWIPQALRDFELAKAQSQTTTDWQPW